MLINDGVDEGFYTIRDDQAADNEVTAAALPWLSGNYQLVLIHLDQVDYAGHHQGGPLSPNWEAAASRADQLLSQIVDTLDLSKDTVLVVSDHGQIDRGGHGGPDPVTLLEPFVLAGVGVVPGNYGNINMVDIAPTMAALLGTNIPASSQGHVLIDMLVHSADQNAVIQNALKSQQTDLFQAYANSIGSTVTPGKGEIVSATQTAMNLARQIRSSTERIWRNVLAAFLAILPGYLIFMRKDKKAFWFLAGAIMYFALFNLRWYFIDHLTYSIASIEGAKWFIIYCATTVIVAFFLSGLIPMLSLKGFKNGVRNAINIILGYVWFTIYILALPILLSFAINGLRITWVLPDWYTLFLWMLSLIQIILVAMLGLILVGAIALSGRISAWKKQQLPVP